MPPPKLACTIGYDAMKKLTDIDELTEESMSNLVVKYAIADAKEMLGRHRSKYDTYPAAGGTVGLDGGKLLDEAEKEKAKLDEDIIERGFPVPFEVG